MAVEKNNGAVFNEEPVRSKTGNSPAAGAPPGKLVISIMAIGLITVCLLMAYLFLKFWPAGMEKGNKGNELQIINFWWKKIQVAISLDVRLILLVMVSGGLGSFIHTATSFADYVGNRTMASSWFVWYILRPFIGMSLALIFYLVVRGGFLSAGTDAGSVNPFGIAALAGLVGMFSKQATDKLNEVFDTLFRTAPGEGDDKRKDHLSNPLPSITDVTPNLVEPFTKDVVVTVTGTGFVKGSVLRINGTNRETEFIDHTQLISRLIDDDVNNEGELALTVFNPAPGGGESSSIKINIGKHRAGELPGQVR